MLDTEIGFREGLDGIVGALVAGGNLSKDCEEGN
jgi:hypothetical protein